MDFWPGSDIHQLNLDWVISKLKEIDNTVVEQIDDTIQDYIDENLGNIILSAAYDSANEEIIYSSGISATDPGGDVSQFAIDSVIVAIKDAVARTIIGTIASLTTTDKTDLVSAINEVDANADAAQTSATTANNAIGTLSNLTTSAKSSLVAAINEVDANADAAQTGATTANNAIGTLSNLTTSAKSSLVAAINEIDANADSNTNSITSINSTLSDIKLSVQYYNIASGSSYTFTANNSHDLALIVYKRSSTWGIYLGAYWDDTFAEIAQNGTAQTLTTENNSFEYQITNTLSSSLPVLFIS